MYIIPPPCSLSLGGRSTWLHRIIRPQGEMNNFKTGTQLRACTSCVPSSNRKGRCNSNSISISNSQQPPFGISERITTHSSSSWSWCWYWCCCIMLHISACEYARKKNTHEKKRKERERERESHPMGNSQHTSSYLIPYTYVHTRVMFRLLFVSFIFHSNQLLCWIFLKNILNTLKTFIYYYNCNYNYNYEYEY